MILGEAPICLSGGADGADLQWGMTAGMAGHTVIHFSFARHRTRAPESEVVRLSDAQLREADPFLVQACAGLQRRFPPRSPFVANLLRRNWYQVRDANAVYAVANLEDGKVSGGTAWAVQMFLDRLGDTGTLDCWLFDQITNKWHQRIDGAWVVLEDQPPVPTRVWAGIGSRELMETGKTAIRRLMGYRRR